MKLLIALSALALSVQAHSATYQLEKQKIRQQLIQCLKKPESSFSAVFNECVLNAATEFQRKSKIEFDSQYSAKNANKDGLIKDRKIFLLQIQACEFYQELSFDGFGSAAQCELSRSQDYFRYLKNDNGKVNWSLENRIDIFFLGY